MDYQSTLEWISFRDTAFKRQRTNCFDMATKVLHVYFMYKFEFYKVGLFVSKSTLKYTELVDFNNPNTIFFATASRQQTKFLQLKNNLFDALQTN